MTILNHRNVYITYGYTVYINIEYIKNVIINYFLLCMYLQTTTEYHAKRKWESTNDIFQLHFNF